MKIEVSSNFLEKIKRSFLEVVFDREYIKDAILRKYIPVEILLDKSIRFVTSLGKRVSILIDLGRCDLITKDVVKCLGLEDCFTILRFIVEKKDIVPHDLKVKIFRKLIEELGKTMYINEYISKLQEYIDKDNELRDMVIEFLVQMDNSEFAKINKNKLPADLMSEVYSKRRKRFAEDRRQSVDKRKNSKRYKNLLHKAIIENDYESWVNCRSSVEQLTEEEFNNLLPYWLKCSPRILSLICRTPYFNKLSEDLRNSIIVTCAKDSAVDIEQIFETYDVKYDVVYVLEKVEDINRKFSILGSFLRRCCIWKKENPETNLESIPELENIITTLLVVQPSGVCFYYAYNIIFNPNFVDEDELDEQVKYFLDFLLREEVSAYPTNRELELYKVMLEFYNKIIPPRSYVRILSQTKEILPLLFSK